MPGAPRVVLAAGGTGGHMFPAEALAGSLIARGVEVILMTDKRGQAFGDALPTVAVHRIRASRLPRHTLDRVRAVVEMGLGGLEARRKLRELDPALVVGFGGYPSIPTILAASMRRIPIVLHEQNALLGRANRKLASRTRLIATSFETVVKVPEGVATELTGNPVRPGIIAMRNRAYAAPVKDGQFSLLVLGGSQGARIFSELVPAAVALLPGPTKSRITIVQQCRPEDIEQAAAAFRDAGVVAEVSTFFTDVPTRLGESHLVIARSGASTVAELAVVGRPAILVPYPFATDDHQSANAEAYAASGGGWVISQRVLTPRLLADRLTMLLTQPDILVRAAEASRRHGRPDAADRLAQVVMAQIGRGRFPTPPTPLKGAAA